MSALTLFDGDSKSQYSETFYLVPGWWGLLTAHGFNPDPVVVDPAEPKTLQMACVTRLRMLYDERFVKTECGCGYGREMYPGMVGFFEDPVVVRGCPWTLSACDTIRVLTVPGLYRLILNDPSAVGEVFVEFDAYTAGTIIRADALSFGASS
jgi:hypothetical protein